MTNTTNKTSKTAANSVSGFSLSQLKANASKTAKVGGRRNVSGKKQQKKSGSKVAGAAKNKAMQLENLANQALLNNQLATAKEHYDQAIALKVGDTSKPLIADDARAYSNRGIVTARLGDLNSSIEDFKRAVELHPDYTAAYSNLANAYLSTQQIQLAYDAITHAIRLDPNDYNAHFNHLIVLNKLKRHEGALAATEDLFIRFKDQVALLDPSPFIDIKKQVCDWREIEVLEQRVATLIDSDKLIAKWALVHINNHALDGKQQLTVLSQYSQQHFGSFTRQPLTPYTRNNRKIRVAYVSSDFHDHATLRLMAEVFEHQSHNRFEWYAISHSIKDHSAIRARVIPTFDHFIEVNDWTDEQVSDWMRKQEIDIAIDLKGHTGSSRLGIFARGCAPVQMTYLGFPGTTGSTFMDYIIGDKWVTPTDSKDEFSEHILQLPHCYQPNDRQRYLPPQALANRDETEFLAWRRLQRAIEGLPTDAVVLCCFNNTYKLHPSVFAIWMRLLKKHPNSVLWLLSDKSLTETNLRAEAKRQGVAPSRIHFAPRTNQHDYLTRYLLADLFVDTFAYNAHTTGSDALWEGLPLVTLSGNSFASRVGASLLNTVGLPQLITYSQTAYEQEIDSLISHPEELSTLSQHLRDTRDSSPLYDAKQTASDLETLYLSVL